jgi:predicted nucleic acid-binding protein
VKRIYWDTMLYAYWFEDNPDFGDRVQQIHEAMQQSGDSLCSSLFVLSELLVGPVKTRDLASADAIEQFFHSDAIALIPFTAESVRIFADLRAIHGIKSLDALHLAIAATARVDLFLTNDRRLHRLKVPGLPFIASLNTDLF